MGKLIGYLGLALVGASLSLVSVYVHLATPLGRRVAADTASSLASGAVEGEIRIEGVRSLWLPEVHADRFLVSMEGEEPLDLRDVRARFDLWATLYNGGPVIRGATVGGGSLDLTRSPNGEPWIERAFHSEDSGEEGFDLPLPSPPGPHDMLIEGVDFENVRFTFREAGTALRLSGTRGRGRMWIEKGADFQGRFTGVSGGLHTTIDVLRQTRVRGVSLSIHPPDDPVVSFSGEAHLLGGFRTFAGHAPHSNDQAVRLCVWSGGDVLTSLAGIAGEAALGLGAAPDVSLDMRPSAAPASPRCGAGS